MNRVDLTGLADGDIRTIERQQNGTHTGDGDAFIHGFTVGVFTGLVSGIGGTVGDEETHQGLFTDFGSAVYDDPKLAKGFQAGHNVGYVASIIGAFFKGTRSSGPAEAGVAKSVAKVPGRVQSRINISNDGWAHTLKGHFNPAKSNKSQFTMSQYELKSLLSDKSIIQSPARQLETGNFGRTVTLDRQVGNLAEKWGGGSTNTFSIVTDSEGNLLTATPGKL